MTARHARARRDGLISDSSKVSGCLATFIGPLESSLKTIRFYRAIANSEIRLLVHLLLMKSCLQVAGEFFHRGSDRRGVNNDQIRRWFKQIRLFKLNCSMSNLPAESVSDHCVADFTGDSKGQSRPRSFCRARSDHCKWPATGPNCASSELPEDCTFVDPVDQADRR